MTTSLPPNPETVSPSILIEHHFRTIKDPRAQHSTEHFLLDIIVLTLCAVICGANDWQAIAEYGRTKQPWLETFLALPNGIPSHDTISRLFARLKPSELESSFMNWMQAVHQVTNGELLNIDGKTLRGAREAGEKCSFIHMVSLWSASNHLVLGQSKVDEKSNEITAIPELLKRLDIEGCLISIDAMGCQREIAKTIIDQGADYVLALKANHGNLYEDVTQLFDLADTEGFETPEADKYQTLEKGHGRIEIRRYSVMENTEYLLDSEKWIGLRSIGMVESERRVNGQMSRIERRYYLLSLVADVKVFAESVRGHWSIENHLHWSLDVSFNEDNVRGCLGHSAENLAVIRHMGLNLLSKEKTTKVGVKSKRLKAGWDNQYLERVLSSLNTTIS